MTESPARRHRAPPASAFLRVDSVRCSQDSQCRWHPWWRQAPPHSGPEAWVPWARALRANGWWEISSVALRRCGSRCRQHRETRVLLSCHSRARGPDLPPPVSLSWGPFLYPSPQALVHHRVSSECWRMNAPRNSSQLTGSEWGAPRLSECVLCAVSQTGIPPPPHRRWEMLPFCPEW